MTELVDGTSTKQNCANTNLVGVCLGFLVQQLSQQQVWFLVLLSLVFLLVWVVHYLHLLINNKKF
jgi:F0F1-type ATP synthase assembly protein I